MLQRRARVSRLLSKSFGDGGVSSVFPKAGVLGFSGAVRSVPWKGCHD